MHCNESFKKIVDLNVTLSSFPDHNLESGLPKNIRFSLLKNCGYDQHMNIIFRGFDFVISFLKKPENQVLPDIFFILHHYPYRENRTLFLYPCRAIIISRIPPLVC